MKENNSLAIIYILLGMTVFSIQDTLVRVMSSEISILQVLFVRSFVAFIFLYLILRLRNIPLIYSTSYPFLTILRSLLFIFAFLAYYIGLAKLDYAVCTALFFTTPFFMTIFSKIFLKEQIGLRRILIIIFGFFGVILIMNPTIESFNYYMILPILCALGYSASMIILKLTSEKDNVYSQAVHVYIITIIVSPLIFYIGGIYDEKNMNNGVIELIFKPWMMELSFSMYLLFLCGLLVVAGFLFIFSAYRIGKPFVIAPFEYTLLLWSIIYGKLIWDEDITKEAWIGMLIIVISGIYIFHRERINNQKIAAEQQHR